MEICSKCQICSYITLLNSVLRPQTIAVILKICVGFRGPLGELALTPDPLAKRLAPSALGIFFLPFPVLYIKNLKLYPAEQSHQKRFSKSPPHPQQERIHNSVATEKNPHTNIGTSSRVQRQDPDPHTPTCEPPKNPASS